MIKLNDYLYNGDTVIKILRNFVWDLNEYARQQNNEIDLHHAAYLEQMSKLLQHTEFLAYQSERMRVIYMELAERYPFLEFSFKGRIKSLIRSEEKFNGYIVGNIYGYYKKHGEYPEPAEIVARLSMLRDLIAYRLVISLPPDASMTEAEQKEAERKYLYEIANQLPSMMVKQGFVLQPAGMDMKEQSPLLQEHQRPYFRDYVANPKASGYQSLHVIFYDVRSTSFLEFQLRTKDMDDHAEIGPANHFNYELNQQIERSRRNEIPVGACVYFDDAYEREIALQKIDLTKLHVNMFYAVSNVRMNDGCGLYRGRLILPYEHLCRT